VIHEVECGLQNCCNCGITTKLPFDCPVIQSDKPVKMWVWDKATGENEKTMKTEKKMKDAFEELKISLIAFSKHSIILQLFNRQRYLNMRNLGPNGAQICTDFSAQLDLEPIRKVGALKVQLCIMTVYYLLLTDILSTLHLPCVYCL